jgi:hypothetical protein
MPAPPFIDEPLEPDMLLPEVLVPDFIDLAFLAFVIL